MRLVTTAHEWPRVSTTVCLVLHCLSYLGLISLTFQPDIYSANADLSLASTVPASVDACQWAIEIVSLVGGVLSLVFILVFLLRPKVLHPWIVAGIVGSLFTTWTVLIGFNCKNLQYNPHLQTGSGTAIAQMAAMYCLTTLVATTSFYLFLLSLSVKFTRQDSSALHHPDVPYSQSALTKANRDTVATAETTPSGPQVPSAPARPISFSPRLSVNTATFGRHSASTFGYHRATFGSVGGDEGVELSPIGMDRSEYHAISVNRREEGG
ncbi:hypothetical protein K505DRAFT_325262 [Melanomma pulvis-pyrius CBS 109.77]|uniref:Uncharacterized protein n=1 Tax=Melanomma pulvis-pyrius CBS 109.77 TaxID=1314802 RepID=A0A6A6XBG7_9PLEO|nr:hypothetical protein K505DRAFT_325262 [Melanomma pulvis-pyrius CBS 109.77]